MRLAILLTLLGADRSGLSVRLQVGAEVGPTNGPARVEPVLGLVVDLISSTRSQSLGVGPVLEARTVGFRQLDADLGVGLSVPLWLEGGAGLGLSTGLGLERLGQPVIGYGFGKLSILMLGESERGFNYLLKSGAFVRVQGAFAGAERVSVTFGIELGGGFLPWMFALWWGGLHD